MLKRLRASLANPSSIPQFRKDNVILVILYIFVLSFIVTLPTLISSVGTSGASVSTKYAIRELLLENKDSFLEGNITNNTLTITNNAEGTVLGEKVAIVLPTDDIDINSFVTINVYYVVKLNTNDIEIYFLGNKIKTYSYDDLNLNGLDFDFINNTNYKERNESFEKIEAAYDKVVNDIKGIWITFDVLKEFARVFFIVIIFDLAFAFLERGLKGISFKECFVISMYSFAIEIVGQIIDSLYGLTICSYIGIAIGIIYFVIAMRNTNNIEKTME